VAHGEADDMAYAVARRRAREERQGKLIEPGKPGHWDKVRQEVGRILGREAGVERVK
jgi:hypothetical protein